MTESDFMAALFDPQRRSPVGVLGPYGAPADKRFSVYRNNVAVSLTEALEVGFSVVQRLVGAEFFAAMAGEFWRRHPPRRQIMMLYGDAFPGFVSTFPPDAAYPHLPDVARLEQELSESYHASDSEPMSADVLAAIPEATLLTSRLTFAPTLRLTRSAWPIDAIWRANTENGPPPVAGPQDVLILRSDFDPQPHLLPVGGGAFLARLLKGANLAEAVTPDLNLSPVLTLLLNGRAITGFHK